MQVILDSSFARPGSAPIRGGKKGEFRDWTRYSEKNVCGAVNQFMIINPGLQSRTVILVTSNKKMLECMTPRGRGGGTPLYGLYRYARP